jgi:hypothetical protein
VSVPITHVNGYASVVVIVLFLVVWAALLRFLARDRGLDAGGALAPEGLACEFATNERVSLFAYANVFDTILSAVVAALPVGVIKAISYRPHRVDDTPTP